MAAADLGDTLNETRDLLDLEPHEKPCRCRNDCHGLQPVKAPEECADGVQPLRFARSLWVFRADSRETLQILDPDDITKIDGGYDVVDRLERAKRRWRRALKVRERRPDPAR